MRLTQGLSETDLVTPGIFNAHAGNVVSLAPTIARHKPSKKDFKKSLDGQTMNGYISVHEHV